MSQTLSDTAMDALAKGHVETAEMLFRRALEMEPDRAEAYHGLACVSLARLNGADAIRHVAAALRDTRLTDEQQGRFHITLGNALLAEGHAEPARAALAVAILYNNRDSRAYGALARALQALGRMDEADAAYLDAIRRTADPVLWHQEYGAFLFERRLFSRALPSLRAVVRRFPDDASAHANLGAVLLEVGEKEEASRVLRRACALGDPTVETLNNSGLADVAAGDFVNALAAFDRALTKAPADMRVLSNKAGALFEFGRHDEAEQILSTWQAAASGLDREHVRFNLSTIWLAKGDWRSGWEAFEARHALQNSSLEQPIWNGQPTEYGITIHPEQGLGDVVQFMRYLPSTAQRTPVLIDLPPLIAPLLERLRLPEGMARTRIQSGRRSGLSASLMSLPRLLGDYGAPDDGPYLNALPPPGKARVGLAWAGNQHYRFDSRRSLVIEQLSPVLSVEGITFVSLQHGEVAGGTGSLSRQEFAHLGETADAIEDCDLVIAVDTVVAHIAGAMGRPVWLLNRHGGDWRWRGPSWYRTVRQFQPSEPTAPPACWTETIAAVAEALRSWRADILC